MGYAKVQSAMNNILAQYMVDIEVDISHGMYAFSIVGLGDKAIGEAKDRISAAIKNCGYKSPKHKNQKVVISLAPADLRKEGPSFDLPMALAYLAAAEEIDFDPAGRLFLGELSLDGELRKISGVLPLVRHAKSEGIKEIFLPHENREEAALIKGVSIYGARHIREIISHLKGERGMLCQPTTSIDALQTYGNSLDFKDICDQSVAKRGLEIAAAGGHNIALYGPPGTGKTMLARAFPSILPRLSFEDMLEITGIHSIAGILQSPLIVEPPFRSPHHTSSHTAIIGGGVGTPKPGEITLAHKGILFLDEFPEFDSRLIESLRQPLEERNIHVSRTKGGVVFPANFLLIAAMNPCPCGNYGISGKICTCTPMGVQKYQQKISGPVMDRIDIWIEVSKVNYKKLATANSDEESSWEIKKRVGKARDRQRERFIKCNMPYSINSDIAGKNVILVSEITQESLSILNDAAERFSISVRSYHRLIKLSRTIADLDASHSVEPCHVYEALQYRPKLITT